MRRNQDSLNPRTHANIMVLSPEDDSSPEQHHPYWYARIFGIYHVNVRHPSLDQSKKMIILHVRWFGRDLEHAAGWTNRRLHRIGFVDGQDPDAFGFLDPELVIRGVHLIPAFADGRTKELLGRSIARQPTEKHEDWRYFYVNW